MRVGRLRHPTNDSQHRQLQHSNRSSTCLASSRCRMRTAGTGCRRMISATRGTHSSSTFRSVVMLLDEDLHRQTSSITTATRVAIATNSRRSMTAATAMDVKTARTNAITTRVRRLVVVTTVLACRVLLAGQGNGSMIDRAPWS